ncbi:MAG: YlbF family regulator [Spirochaetia bacterium]|nr:YlbF family regulator [Spirochaetia bacterium]
MISRELQNTADTLVTALEKNESISAYQAAKRRSEENEELKQLRATYSELLPELQQKQADGTLTQEDIGSLRSLQEQINQHPASVELLRTLQEATPILKECNSTISRILGFDFSAHAAPPSGCC